MNEFDNKAAEWDKDQMRWDRAAAIAGEIMKQIPLRSGFKAMEYGAGTGILSFILKDHLNEILLIDNSPEMIKQADEKIRTTGSKNMNTRLFDLEHSDLNGETFDLIYTLMVLHHVNDVESMIKKYKKMLKPEGFLAIADLCEEDGSFHGEGFTGHNGFNADKLISLVSDAGFQDVSHKKCFTIKRITEENKTKEFDMFLLTAKVC